jgi:hypothetical protein
MYYGTDPFYLNYLARLVKPGGPIAIAEAGLVREVEGPVPKYLREWWAHDGGWSLHTATAWRRQWEHTGILDIDVADTMPDGWQLWLTWIETGYPENRLEIDALKADAGRTLGYVRVAGRRNPQARLFEPIVSCPVEYAKKALMREES